MHPVPGKSRPKLEAARPLLSDGTQNLQGAQETAHKLVESARSAAAMQPISYRELLNYFLVILSVLVEGVLAMVSVDVMFRRMSMVLPTAGMRLRVRKSLTNYTLAVRIGNILAVLVDAVVVGILEKPDGVAILQALALTAYGDDPIERVHSINSTIMADFVAPRLAKLDLAFIKVLTSMLFLWSSAVAVAMWILDLNFRVSSLFFHEPADGTDDGTSVYRLGLYAVIITFASIFATVLVAILFVRSFLTSASEIMMDLDEDDAAALLARTQEAMGITPPTRDRTKAASPLPKHTGSNAGGTQVRAASETSASVLPPAWAGDGQQDVHVVMQWADGVRKAAPKSGSVSLDYKSLIANNILWLVHAEPDDMREWWRQLSADVDHSDKEMKQQSEMVLSILNFGFHALNVFLLISLNLSNDTLRRILITAACVVAVASGISAGYITSSMRSYSTIVLAEAARHINAVLNVAEAIQPSNDGWRGLVRRACVCITVQPRKSGGFDIPQAAYLQQGSGAAGGDYERM